MLNVFCSDCAIPGLYLCKTFFFYFQDSDKYLEDIHDKERSPDSDDCKGRFRARMQKCFGKYVKFINEEKDKEFKCKRVAKYKILCIPHCYTGMFSFFISL